MSRPLRLVVLGLSLSSSWGNGHATTYRALLRAMARRGHDILFLERDQRWYAAHRDLHAPTFCELVLYRDLRELERYRPALALADAAIIGSFVPDGITVGTWVQRVAEGVTAFYDIDTPVTLASLARGDCTYLTPAQIRDYDLYLSFTGGPTLQALAQRYGAPAARALYCSVDDEAYRPVARVPRYDLGYLGTYSADRQDSLDRLLLEPARRMPNRRFLVGGAQYPDSRHWPPNVTHLEHVPPGAHAEFYGSCRFTLNVTRAEMIRAGFSPSVRLFEAGACAAPVISDRWDGIDSFFTPDREILLAESTEQVLDVLATWSEPRRQALAAAARRRTLRQHTAAHRAAELEAYLLGAIGGATRQLAAVV
jgi:spore maturation protein CgeB